MNPSPERLLERNTLREVEHIPGIPLPLPRNQSTQIGPIIRAQRHITIDVILIRLRGRERPHRLIEIVDERRVAGGLARIRAPVRHRLDRKQGASVHERRRAPRHAVDRRLRPEQIVQEISVLVRPGSHRGQHGVYPRVGEPRRVHEQRLRLERLGGELEVRLQLQPVHVGVRRVAGVDEDELDPRELLDAGGDRRRGGREECGEESGEFGFRAQVGAFDVAIAGRVEVEGRGDFGWSARAPRLERFEVLELLRFGGPLVAEVGDGEGDVVHSECELRDDAEGVRARAAEREEEVGVLGRGCSDDGSVREHHLRGDDVVRHEAELARGESPSAAERVARNADRDAVARRDGHLAGVPEREVERPEAPARAHDRRASGAVVCQLSEARHVHHQHAVATAERVILEGMPAAARRNPYPRGNRARHRVLHLRHRRWKDERRGRVAIPELKHHPRVRVLLAPWERRPRLRRRKTRSQVGHSQY